MPTNALVRLSNIGASVEASVLSVDVCGIYGGGSLVCFGLSEGSEASTGFYGAPTSVDAASALSTEGGLGADGWLGC